MFERTPARLWWTSLLTALVLAGCYEDNEVEPEPDAAPPIVDECTGTESRACFVTGNCTGTQTCQDGFFGECNPPAETCDGQDNDCDGTADEDFPTLGDDCQGGQGKCIDQGRVVCTADGSGVECDARPGDATEEVCDAIDNDCDGMVDEDIAAGIACETGLPGACGAGQTACVGGDTVCEPTVEASDEVCDGIDNDCNGAVDDAEVGGPLVESCYEGPNGTEDVGACAAGVRTCADGMFGACEGSVTPTSESCDEVDNDCDGEVDNVAEGECVCVPGVVEDCYSGPDGTAGVGVCRAGRRTCNAEGTAFSACEGERVPGVELCDGADNDCNGALDDVAGLGEACGEGQGACAAEGVRVCDLESGQVVCDAQAGLPADEICDGIDNDCDGQIDDLDGAGEPCAVGEGACIGRGVLRCDPAAGQLTCSAVEGQPAAETCNNLDDDCNGEIDDVPGLGMDCSIGIGACRSTAVTVCDVAAGAVVCPATEQDPAPAEYCGNGIDDDCDGDTDDDACVTPCAFDDDCRVGESCVEGVCVADACVTDDDCDDGLACVEGTCREPVASGCGDARPVGFGRHDAVAEGDSAFGLASCTLPPNSTDGPEVVFAFTPDVAGDVCVSTAGSAFDTVLTVRRDPCEEAASEIACNDDVGDGFDLSSRVGFAAMAGMTYYIVVDTFEGESGAVVLDIAAGPCAPAPGDEICDNTQDDDGDGAVDCEDSDCAADPGCQDPDLCVDAMPVGLGRTEGMVEGASRTTLASCTRPADAAAGPEMVYAFTAEAAGTLCIDTRGSQIDTILTVREAPCGAGDEIACNDDAADTLDSELELEAMAGMTYYLVVDTFAGEAGGFVLNINEGACEAGPVDEICDNGEDDDGDGAVDCEDLGCAFDPACPILGDEICDNNLDDDDDGDVDCQDDDCFLDPRCLLGLDEICDNGEDDDDDGAVDCADADCALDPACFEPATCDDATEIGFGTFEGTLEGPSSTDLASCTFFPNDAGGPEAFFAFTSAAGGQVCVDTRGSEPDTILTVRVDPCEDPDSEVACNDDIDFIGGLATSEIDFVAEAGTTYYIVVDTFARDGGDFVLNVSEGPCGDIGDDEICDDGVDNDGDEAIDCEDADCAGDPACAPVCVPDDFEPNEDADSATPIMAGSYADLSICFDDNDFFAIEICDGGTLTLDVLFAHAEGDIDVLFGDAEVVLVRSESVTDNEQIVFVNEGPTATFYAQVFGFDPEGTPYSLEVAIDGCDGPVEICDNGVDDDGDETTDCEDADCIGDPACGAGTCADAVPLEFGRYEGTTTGAPSVINVASCTFGAPDRATGPEIVYALTLDADTRVCADTFGSAYDTLLYVRGEPCEDVASEVACNDDANDGLQSQLEFDAVAGTTYYLFLDGYLGGNGEFVLNVQPCEVPVVEICDNGVDDDGDDAIDCEDAGCALDPACLPPVEICDNGADDDGDDAIDCEDADCALDPACLACPDAANEPNEAIATATPILVGDYPGLAICGPGDQDFYGIELGAGCTITIDLTFTHADGDIELNLRNAANTTLRSSTSSDDNEQIVYTNAGATALHYIRVFGFQGAQNDYALSVAIDCPEPVEICDNEIDDDGDDAIDCEDPDCVDAGVCVDGVEGALRLVGGADERSGRLEVFHEGVWGTVCDDLWENPSPTTTPQGFTNADVACRQLGFAGAAGTFDAVGGVGPIWLDNVACVGNEGRLIDCPANALGSHNCVHSEDIGLRCLADGACRVDGNCEPGEVCVAGACVGGGEICDNGQDDDGDDAIDCEDADCAADPACEVGCVPDDFEPNDDIATATAIGEGVSLDLTICADNDDFYAIEVCAGGTLTLDVLFIDDDGDIDVEFGDAEGVITSSESGSDNEQIVFLNEGATATFYARVFGFEGAENTYDLGVVIDGCAGPVEICDNGVDDDGDDAIDCADADCAADPACVVCPDDANEPNEGIADATPVMAGAYADLAICGDGDVDVYAIELCAGGTITVDVTFIHDAGDLDAHLRDGADANVDTSTGVGDAEQLVYTNEGPAATYYIRVFGFEDAQNPYDLAIVIENCDGDGQEICDNGVDDDGDDAIDCADVDCALDPACVDPVDTLPVFFTTPAAAGNPPGVPTLLYTLGVDGQPVLVGPITLGGVPVSVSAIALAPDGTLVGFVEDALTIYVTIDTATGVADDSDGILLPTLVVGAAYAPDGTLWVLDLFDQVARPVRGGELGAASFALPNGNVLGGDLVFDGDGNCYFTGVTFEEGPTGLFACDVEAGTLDPLAVLDQGFDGAGARISGLAVGPSPDPCVATVFGLDAEGVEQIGVWMPGMPMFVPFADLPGDFSDVGFVDAAGYFVRPDLPECELPAEICDNGADDDRDGDVDCEDADCDADPACEVVAPRAPQIGDLAITEIMYDPARVDDSVGEFIEVRNISNAPLELMGMRFRDNTNNAGVTINNSLVVPPGGYVVAARSINAGVNGGVPAMVALGNTLQLGNTNDIVRITYGTPEVDLDSVTYNEGMGWPVANGQSLQLGAEHDPRVVDNNSAAFWCLSTVPFGAGDLGTPGADNTRCAPEPPVAEAVDFCRLQFPAEIEGIPGDRVTVYGRFYEAGITDRSNMNDAEPGARGQLGYIADGADPADPASWTWIDAIPNPGYVGGDEPNNDEHQVDLVLPAVGLYSYAFRFTVDDATSWTLCDLDGAGANLDGGNPGSSFSIDAAGLMLIEPNPCPEACREVFACNFGMVAGFANEQDCLNRCNAGEVSREQAQCVADVLGPPPAGCNAPGLLACQAL